MPRTFLALALADGLLLVDAFARGLVDGKGRAHAGLGLAAVAATLAVHASAHGYLYAAGRRARGVVRDFGLPAWVNDQASKNRRKPLRVGLAASALVGAFAWPWPGTWAKARGLSPVWHLGASAFALAFNLGAFAVEWAAVVAQDRLLREVRSQADRLRAAGYGPGGVARG